MSDLETNVDFIGQHLTEICQHYNEIGHGKLWTPGLVEELTFRLQATTENQPKSHWARMSSIGKPTVCTAVNKLLHDAGLPFGCGDESTPRMQTAFMFGNVFEEWLILVGEKLGYWNVVQQQTEVKLDAMVGHVDFIIEVNSNLAVIECKTLSPNYHRTFNKQPDDDRGYLTQLSLYSHCTGLPGFWLTLDKGTGQLSFVGLPDNAEDKVNRAIRVVQACSTLKHCEDVINKIIAPPPVEEIYKRKPTGRYLVPPSMTYSGLVDIFYETVVEDNGYGKPTLYVVDYREHGDAVDRLVKFMAF